MAEMKTARFLTTLHTRRGANGRWVLASALLYFSVVADRLIIVPRGFESDYASVPRVPFAYWLFGGLAEEAAVIHDALYSSQEVSRKLADEVFVEACKVLNVAPWRRTPMWVAIRLFGGSYYKKQAEPT